MGKYLKDTNAKLFLKKKELYTVEAKKKKIRERKFIGSINHYFIKVHFVTKYQDWNTYWNSVDEVDAESILKCSH